MKKVLSLLVALCTTSILANDFINPQFHGGFPGGIQPGMNHQLIYMANDLVGVTNVLLNDARRIVGNRVSIRERQALGRIEDLNRLSYEFNQAAQFFGRQMDPRGGGIMQLRQLQYQLEQAAYMVRQTLPDLFMGGFGGHPHGFPHGRGFPGQPGFHQPGFPGGPGMGMPVDPQWRYRLEELLRRAEDIIRAIRFQL